ncbi:hypothetical protein HDU98_005011, partial [Podochytrium sp. JEL0797]
MMTPADWRALHLGASSILVSLSMVDRTIASAPAKPIADTQKPAKKEPFLVGLYGNNLLVQQTLATCVVFAGLIQMADVLIFRSDLFEEPWTSSQRRSAYLSHGFILLRLWAMGTLEKDFTFTVTKPRELCRKGPYEILLHPGYTGIIGWSIFQSAWLFDDKAVFMQIITRGGQLLLDHCTNPMHLVSMEVDKLLDVSWFLFAFALVAAAVLLPPGLIKRMELEEEELKNAFGDTFEAYKKDR